MTHPALQLSSLHKLISDEPEASRAVFGNEPYWHKPPKGSPAVALAELLKRELNRKREANDA